MVDCRDSDRGGFAARLAKAMQDKGVKQADLVNNLSITKGTASNWVAGRTEPHSVRVMNELADFLGVSVDWLLYGSDRPDARQDQPTLEITSEKILGIDTLSFYLAGWVFYDGQSHLEATLSDEDFLAGVYNGSTRFARGDLLRVKLRTIQRVVDGRLQAGHEIISVIEHIKK